MRSDRQDAAAGCHIGDPDIGADIGRAFGLAEGGADPVADRAACHKPPENVVICRQNDLAVDDPGADRRIKAEIAAEQHRDGVGAGMSHAVNHVVVAHAVAGRAADGAIDRHHLAACRRADRNRDVEQPVRKTEVHHLARDKGMAAVDERGAAHFDVGGDHREKGVFGRGEDLRARIDQDTRRRTRCPDHCHVAAQRKVLERGWLNIQRGEQQAADIEGGGAADQDSGRRIERHHPGRRAEAVAVDEARQHFAIDGHDIVVGGRQNPVQHRKVGNLRVAEFRARTGGDEIERVAVHILVRRPVDHHGLGDEIDPCLPRPRIADRSAAEHHCAVSLDALCGGLIGRKHKRERQRGAGTAAHQARTVADRVGHLNTSTAAGGRSG